MRRRDFAIGLGASGIAGRALAQALEGGWDASEFRNYSQVRLQLPGGSGRRRVDSVVFLDGLERGLRFFLNAEYRFRNDDRITVSGVTQPTALQMARNGTRLAPVRFDGKSLVCSSPIAIRTAQTTLVISDGESSYLIGGLRNLDTEQTDRIPGLGGLPLIGALFRDRGSQQDKHKLLILVHPSVIVNE